MKYFKKLVGNSIYLSPINTDDYEQYCIWLNDLSTAIPIGLATTNIPIIKEKEILNSLAKDHNYAIVSKDDDKLLGNCSLNNINMIHKTATLGIFIGDKNNRNKGYGKEAIELILSYGFKVLNLNNIMLNVYSFNKPGISAYEKLGFKVFGKRTEAFIMNNKYYDTIYMEILQRDFKSNLLTEVIEEITFENS